MVGVNLDVKGVKRRAGSAHLHAVARHRVIGSVGPAEGRRHRSAVQDDAITLKNLFPSRAKYGELGHSNGMQHGLNNVPACTEDEWSVDDVRFEHGLWVVPTEHVIRLLHKGDEVLLQMARTKTGAIDHDNRLR